MRDLHVRITTAKLPLVGVWDRMVTYPLKSPNQKHGRRIMEKPVYVVSWSEPYVGSTLVLATSDYSTAVEKFEELADSRDYSVVLLDEWVDGEATSLDSKRSW